MVDWAHQRRRQLALIFTRALGHCWKVAEQVCLPELGLRGEWFRFELALHFQINLITAYFYKP